MSDDPEPETNAYSKAFEQLVYQSDDIEGLLAYALYKQTLHERRQKGMAIALAAARCLATSEIDTFRGKARNVLKVFEKIVISKEKEDIIASGALRVTQGIRDEIKSATAWWPNVRLGVAVGIAAWIISLILTIIVAALAPEKAQDVAKILGVAH